MCAPCYWVSSTNPLCRVNGVLNIITNGVDEDNVAKLFVLMNSNANLQIVLVVKNPYIFYMALTCLTMVISYRIFSSHGGSDEVLQWLDMQNNLTETTFFEEFGNLNLYLQVECEE